MKKLIIIAFLIFLPVVSYAQGFNFIGKVPCTGVTYRCLNETGEIDKDKDCRTSADCGGRQCRIYEAGNCSLQQMFDAINIIIQWGTGVSGAIALLMYVIGGIFMLTSGGSQEKVTRGKNILVGTTIALFFILGSWIIVNFILNSFGATKQFQLQSECTGAKNYTSCGNGIGVCYNNQCMDSCSIVDMQDPDNNWSCGTLESCGLKDYGCQGDFCDDEISDGKSKSGCGPGMYCCYPAFLIEPDPTPREIPNRLEDQL